MPVVKDKASISNSRLWMRAVPFVALRDLAVLVNQHPEGLRAKDMEKLILEQGWTRTQYNKPPSKTTIYHYRNTLLHLSVLLRHDRLYRINWANPAIKKLLETAKPGTDGLSVEERRLFSEIVISNRDCHELFFHLFTAGQSYRTLTEFIAQSSSVAWKTQTSSGTGKVEIYNLDHPHYKVSLRTENEIQAVLYGLRYWARTELGFIDELFLEDLGGIMYPVKLEGQVPDKCIIDALRNAILEDDEEWITMSVRRLVFDWGPKYKVPIDRIYRTLMEVYRKASRYIVLIPTTERFATITASSPVTERYQLRSYLQDERGRYISHIRVHRKLREVL